MLLSTLLTVRAVLLGLGPSSTGVAVLSALRRTGSRQPLARLSRPVQWLRAGTATRKAKRNFPPAQKGRGGGEIAYMKAESQVGSQNSAKANSHDWQFSTK